MTAEEAFAEAYAELERMESEGTTIHELMDAQYKATGQLFGSVSFMLENWPAPSKLRILPAEQPPKEESKFGVLLGMLTVGITVLTLAGMKLWDIFWRLTR